MGAREIAFLAVDGPARGRGDFAHPACPLASDPTLLVAFRRGDRSALERVYRSHVRGLDGYLHEITRRWGSAELSQASALADLLQEAFIRAFSEDARRSYDGVRDYAAYLKGIAKNLVIDSLRAKGREVLTDPDDFDDEVAAGEDGHSLDPHVATVLSAYLTEIDGALRSVYEQRFARGLSQEDACAALQISRRSLRTAEAKLRKGLKRALVRNGIDLKEMRPEKPGQPKVPAGDRATGTAGGRP
jgi:RNA polymerase sigma factor (sigma-70 family)